MQAIPTFAMSCFKLFISLCKDIECLIHRFWWGIPKERKGICWKSWAHLCCPKDYGCLGF